MGTLHTVNNPTPMMKFTKRTIVILVVLASSCYGTDRSTKSHRETLRGIRHRAMQRRKLAVNPGMEGKYQDPNYMKCDFCDKNGKYGDFWHLWSIEEGERNLHSECYASLYPEEYRNANCDGF